MSRRLGFFTTLFALLFADCVSATELVRVLLYQEVPRVQVAAARGLLVRLPNGKERMMTSPIEIRATQGGLVVNGHRIDAESVSVRGAVDDVSVTVPVLASKDQKGGRIEAPSPKGDADRASPVRPQTSVMTLVVGGIVQVLSRPKGLLVVNELDLEEYVKGVVPSEMNPAWHPEALKVQAVATRTYALYQRMMNGEREYHVIAGVQDQVYRGRQGVDQRVHQAVEATRGLVLTYQNMPIFAAFSSTAAGATEDAVNVWSQDLPYLKGVDCPFDANSPYYQWRAELKVEDLEQTLRKQGIRVGTIATVTPFAYSRAGRVTRLRILHSEGELILRGEELRRFVGYSTLPSTLFEVEALGRELVLSGRGNGHAVGLCQWGAKELADMGYSFSTILNYYFPGTELRHVRAVQLVSSGSAQP